MPRLEIRPFSAEFLGPAAELLAVRHRAHRSAEPLLPERYEDPAATAEEIAALAGSEGASGAVALRNGRVVGYVLGVRKSDELWGANVWVELAGHAVEELEDLRDLYAAAAQGWVDHDVRLRHYALVPAADLALLDAWFRAGFGQQHAYGIQAGRRSATSSSSATAGSSARSSSFLLSSRTPTLGSPAQTEPRF